MRAAVRHVTRLSHARLSTRAPARLTHGPGPVLSAPRPSVPITFVTFDGHRYTVSATVGATLLEAADSERVPLLGECGGGGWPRENYGEGPMCRSCLVYIDHTHLPATNKPTIDEQRTLYWITESNHNSRLACETVITPEMSGSTIVIPNTKPLKTIYV